MKQFNRFPSSKRIAGPPARSQQALTQGKVRLDPSVSRYGYQGMRFTTAVARQISVTLGHLNSDVPIATSSRGASEVETVQDNFVEDQVGTTQ